MIGISSALRLAQRARRRSPDLSVQVSESRFAVPYFDFQWQADDAEPSAPHDSIHSPAAGFYSRVRNNAGNLDTTRDFGNTWTNLDTVTAGQGLAVRYDPIAQVFGLLYGDGNDLKFRTSADGLTWSAATTVVTEASAIGSVALAFNPNTGNACAFYTLGTTTTLKRLRRTSGTWAASGTTWSKTGSVASLTGVSAAYIASSFVLVITGTEVTTLNKRCWAAVMGDGALPSNLWFGPVAIAEADAAASLTFSHPHLAASGSNALATFQQVEAGNVASSRIMYTTTNADAQPLTAWREPYPLPVFFSSHGASIAVAAGAVPVAQIFSPNSWHSARNRAALDLSANVLSCTWTETPTSLKVRVELDNSRAQVLDPYATPSTTTAPLAVGLDLTVQDGLTVGHGSTIRANIDRIVQSFAPGKATVTIEASGPWEQMARFRAPQAWTAPASTTRKAIFQRVAGKAGLSIGDSSDLTPSTSWSTDTPAFAIAPGESAAQTLLRLISPTPDQLRIGSAGGFEICAFGFGDYPPDDDSAFAFAPDADFPNPYLTLDRIAERAPNWSRAVGPARYADTFPQEQLSTYTFPTEPLLQLIRDLNISTDTIAGDAAYAGLARPLHATPTARLTTPNHSQFQLYDVISIGPIGYMPTININFRIIERGADYRRDPRRGDPAYTSRFLLTTP